MRYGCKSRGNANLYLCALGTRKTISMLHIFTIGIPILLTVVCCPQHFGCSSSYKQNILQVHNEQNSTKYNTRRTCIFRCGVCDVFFLIYCIYVKILRLFFRLKSNFFRVTEAKNRRKCWRKYKSLKTCWMKAKCHCYTELEWKERKKTVSANNLNMKIYRQIVFVREKNILTNPS